jgi:hypothetical protein
MGSAERGSNALRPDQRGFPFQTQVGLCTLWNCLHRHLVPFGVCNLIGENPLEPLDRLLIPLSGTCLDQAKAASLPEPDASRNKSEHIAVVGHDVRVPGH